MQNYPAIFTIEKHKIQNKTEINRHTCNKIKFRHVYLLLHPIQRFNVVFIKTTVYFIPSLYDPYSLSFVSKLTIST